MKRIILAVAFVLSSFALVGSIATAPPAAAGTGVSQGNQICELGGVYHYPCTVEDIDGDKGVIRDGNGKVIAICKKVTPPGQTTHWKCRPVNPTLDAYTTGTGSDLTVTQTHNLADLGVTVAKVTVGYYPEGNVHAYVEVNSTSGSSGLSNTFTVQGGQNYVAFSKTTFGGDWATYLDSLDTVFVDHNPAYAPEMTVFVG